LLASRIGPARVRAEPAATDDIVRMCARLPLALAIVAARAAIHPQFSLAVLADQLRQTRGLEAFDDHDESTDVRAVFSWSYQILGPPVARLFRLLGLHPGPHLTVASTASLAGVTRREALRALAELARANLIEEPVPGRYAFHDLLRAYAGELVQGLDAPDERRAAVRRMLDHYVHTAYHADRLLDPQDAFDLPAAAPEVIPEDLTECEQALAWFTAEHPVLLGAVEQAAAARLDTHAWQLARTTAVFLHRQGHWYDQITAQDTALTTARRAGDAPGQAYAHRTLARAQAQLGHIEDAHRHLRSALELYVTLDDPIGQAHTYLVIDRVLYQQGRYREALSNAQQALRLFERAGHRGGRAAALNAVGWFHLLLEDYHKALECCRQAITLHRQLDDPAGVAAAQDSLGYAYHRLSDHAQAIGCYRDAIDLWRQLGDRFNEADTLGRLGDTHHAAGDVDAACAAWQQGLGILESLHHPAAGELTVKLDKLAVGSICA
jgi:tetratricopeptide (TPR) repeat protein